MANPIAATPSGGQKRQRPSIWGNTNASASTSSSSKAVKGPPKPPKRQKRAPDDTARLVTAAVLAEQSSSSVSSYLAVREESSNVSSYRSRGIPTLGALTTDVIIDNFTDLFLTGAGQLRNTDQDALNAKAWLDEFPPRVVNRLLAAVLHISDTDGSDQRRITVSAMTELFLKSGKITSFILPSSFFRAAQAQYDPNSTLSEDPENALLSSTAGKEQADFNNSRKALKRAGLDRFQLLTSLSRCTSLRTLDLSGQVGLEDGTLASLLPHLGELEELVVKGCIEVGDKSVLAVANKAGRRQKLKVINLNYTAVTVKGLRGLFARCKSLEVLKLASVNGLSDPTVTLLLSPENYIAEDWKTSPFLHLKNLKLRGTKIGDGALTAFLALSPSLETLDIAYTQVKSLDTLSKAITDSIEVAITSLAPTKASGSPSKIISAVSALSRSASPALSSVPDAITLRKLSISGLKFRKLYTLERFFREISSVSLDRRKRLETLKLGTLEMASSALQTIVPHLEKFQNLKKVSLFGNTTLTGTGVHGPMRRFLASVGRKCTVLDLSNINLSSRDFASAFLEESLSYSVNFDQDDNFISSPLRVLLLDNTHINDETTVALSTLHDLEELHIEQSKITVEGLSRIMDGCKKLRVLNLTGCRGIPTRQRREWFDLYERGEVGEED